MSKRSTKEKKLRKKMRLESSIKENDTQFDIMDLLKTTNMETKPNMGKFLQEHVKIIRIFNPKKIQVYPTFEYEIAKVFVKFLDGHELIMDCHANKCPGFETQEFFLYFNCEEIEMNQKEMELVKQFFQRLFEFKFVY